MSAIGNRLTSRVVKRLEKPKPLKQTIQPARYSSPDVPSLGGASSLDDIMAQVDAVSMYISAKNFAELVPLTSTLTSKLKAYGPKLEESYKEKLDKAFQHIRNGCRDEKLDFLSRVNLLYLVELRAMQWQPAVSTSFYYTSKAPAHEQGIEMDSSGHNTPVNQLLLGPGELIKSSGKYSSPTKLPGKTYCKDEVVIRNADSGKVMGIKGRRVHLIEELSETIISFQRVNPGAKERLVQITGPTENKINFAKQLIEETIRKNASPVREVEKGHLKGSTSSLTSSDSEDSASANHDAMISDLPDGMPYAHTVSFGDNAIEMTSSNLEMLTESKIVLECYFKKKKSQPANSPHSIEDLVSQITIANAGDAKSPTSPPPHIESSKKEVVEIVTSKVSQPPVFPLPQPAAIPAPIIKQEKRMRIEYTRQFLLDCSTCPAAYSFPRSWDQIKESCPEVVKVQDSEKRVSIN